MKPYNVLIISIIFALICESFVLPALATQDETPNEGGVTYPIEGKDRRRKNKNRTTTKAPSWKNKIKSKTKETIEGIIEGVGEAGVHKVVDQAVDRVIERVVDCAVDSCITGNEEDKDNIDNLPQANAPE